MPKGCSCHPHPVCQRLSCVFHYSSPGTSREALNETFPQPLDFTLPDGIMRPSWNESSPALPIASRSHSPPLPALRWVFSPAGCWEFITAINNPRVTGNSLPRCFFFFFLLERIPAHLSSGILGDDCSLINPAAIPPSLPAPPAGVFHFGVAQTFIRAIPNVFLPLPREIFQPGSASHRTQHWKFCAFSFPVMP